MDKPSRQHDARLWVAAPFRLLGIKGQMPCETDLLTAGRKLCQVLAYVISTSRNARMRCPT